VISEEKKILLSEDYPLSPEIFSAIGWMKQNVPNDNRIFVESTFGTLTTQRLKDWYLRGALQDNKTFPIHSHALSLIPVYTEIPTLGSWANTDYIANKYGVTAHGNIFGTNTNNINDAWVISYFVPAIRELGISFVLSHSTNLTKLMEKNDSFFKERYSNKVFHIFEVVSTSKIFTVDSSENQTTYIELVKFDPNYLELNVYNLTSTSYLEIKMIYYPNWKCYVDGEKRDIEIIKRLDLPFMAINLRKNDSNVILKFEETPTSLAGKMMSCGTGVLVLIILLYHSRSYISTFIDKIGAEKGIIKRKIKILKETES